MSVVTVGVRDLKTRLSKYLRQVRDGQVVVITDHGKPVGRIIPDHTSVEESAMELVKAGLVAWNGKKLRDFEPVAVNRSDKLLSDIVIEMRE